MRKVLNILMMLLLLTPGLACASSICNMLERSQQQPCHDMGADTKQTAAEQENAKYGVMFLMDCAGIDFQTVSPFPDITGPDISFEKLLVLDGLDFLPASNFPPLAVHAIRGPPPQWVLFATFQPSIILTTQRLRI